LAESDVCAYAHLSSLSSYVLIYYTARSHFSVVNATLPSLDCIAAFEIALGNMIDFEGCIHAYLCDRFARCLAGLITCHDNLAVSDVCAYAHLTSLRSYVLIYYTACSRFSIVNASLPSLDCCPQPDL